VVAWWSCTEILHVSDRTTIGWLLAGLAFTAMGAVASRSQVYFGVSSTVAMGTIPQVAALLVLPTPVALLAITASKILSETSMRIQKGRRPLMAMVVNIGGAVFANLAAILAFQALHGQEYLWANSWTPVLAFPALIALAIAYHLVDVLLVVVAISLSSSDSPLAVFGSTFRSVLIPSLSLVLVGVIFALLWHASWVLFPLVLVPVWYSSRSFANLARQRQETMEAVFKMAESIDYRDTLTYEHSERLVDLTRRLARSLGLIQERTEEVVLAARVHDLGKIGISNDILHKQGMLTEEERRVIEEHPVIGAQILSSYSGFRESLAFVRHHHERWDGTGYPDGLRGEDIPLGARIITVVDSFDAMTSDRPYRNGMSVENAVERLKDGMGSQFDPTVTAKFIQMLIEAGQYTPPAVHPELRVLRVETGA
jgi:HD-GYP domain-containing protein (c-di-GMP phosphodiesterase class II)